MNLEQINEKYENGYNNNALIKGMIWLTIGILAISLIGYVKAEDKTFTQSYEINEFENMVFNLDINYSRTLDYRLTQTNYVRHMFGRITDTGTGLTFKNMEIYQIYLDTGIIYREYVTENIYLEAFEYFIRQYNLVIKEKQITINNGETYAQ